LRRMWTGRILPPTATGFHPHARGQTVEKGTPRRSSRSFLRSDPIQGGSPSPRPSPLHPPSRSERDYGGRAGRGRGSGRYLKARWPWVHRSRGCPFAQKLRQYPGASLSTNVASASPSPGGEGRGEGGRVIHACGSAPPVLALLHAQRPPRPAAASNGI